jgi:CBS domain containing-hemolysin-like protein
MIFTILSIAIIAFMICISAFFSGSEMALVSIDRALIADKVRKGDKRAKVLEELLKKPDDVISAIVIGNNIVNIFASILAGFVATKIFGNLGIGIATAVMFILVIIFSESTPKAFGRKNERWALKSAKSIFVFTKIFYPAVVFVRCISNGLLHIIGKPEKKGDFVTEEKIMAMMKLGEEEGTIEKDERAMVNEVFEFDKTIADEVDKPKYKMEFIHQNDTIEKLIEKSVETGFSRFPVYKKNYDDVVGMAHVKDSLNIKDTSKEVQEIMRDVLIVNPSMKADDVFRKMREYKTHLAVLKDKSGKTIGLVSMEDLVEEIFGEISDEHDPT